MERKNPPKAPNKKLAAGQQTLGQFLDFGEQVRRGEIEEVDVEAEAETKIEPGIIKAVKMDHANDRGRQVPLPSVRGGGGRNPFSFPSSKSIPSKTMNPKLDGDDSSDSDCDASSYRSKFQTLTIDQKKTPESIVSSGSAKSTSSSGGSFRTLSTGSSEDSPGQQFQQPTSTSRTRGGMRDFSALYYAKPSVMTGVGGRGRGMGRGIGLKSSYLRSDSPSNEIPVDISSKTKFKNTAAKYKALDSDDSDPNETLEKTRVKSRNSNALNSTPPPPPQKAAFLTKKLIDKPEKITKHSDSTPLDFPGRLLTRGPLLVSPLGVINHFVHYKAMTKGIKNCGLDEFNSLQKSVAPHFLRTDDCFITGGIGSGKTLSYLIPMVGKLLAESSDETSGHSSQQIKNGSPNKAFVENNQAHQPVAIIVCSDKRSATKIDGHLFNLLSAGQRQLSYALVCEGKDRKTVRKGVDIITTSVHFFSNMLRTSSMYLGFEKLRFFVFEDIDVLLRAFRKEFDHIQDVLSNIAAKHSSFLIQRVFCGKEWCTEVEDLYMGLESLEGSLASTGSNSSSLSVPTIFINSPNQVIKYSEMKWFMHHCADHEKIESLTSLLKSEKLYVHKSIFVLCSTAEIAMVVHHELSRNDVYTLLAETENMTQATIPLLKNQWEDFPCPQRIMVLNDTMLRGLNIYDVTCLINYDMPSKMGAYAKSSTGADRFSCMWSNFRDIAKEKVDPTWKSHRVGLEAHFLLTGEETALYKLKSFAVNISCEMPEALVFLADQMEKEAIMKLPFCNGIKEFGRCVETVASNCKSRHSLLLSELEKESVVPSNGEIEVRISESLNPTTYTAQVLRCFEYIDGKRKLRYGWIQKFKSISDDLKKHFEAEENRIPPKSFDVGSLCAVKNLDGIFRARILQILTRTDLNYPKQLRVFCVDSGYFLQPSAENVLCLPDNLHTDQRHQLAVELILGNLQPVDGENSYGSVAKSKAKDLTLEQILNGRVQFAIGETVWVNPLVDLGRDAVDANIKTRSSIRLELIKSKCAENNDNHLKNIFDLCRRTGYQCPELNDVQPNPLIKDVALMSKFHDIGDDYQWAFVPTCRIDNPETVEIMTSFTKNPHCIFGTNGKFDSELNAVIVELNDSVKELISDRCADYATQFASYYQKGMVVAVKDRVDNSWQRGLILDIHDGVDGKSLHDIFLVDVGDEQNDSLASELFPIMRKLVGKLPFQAISFELAHIKPIKSIEGDADAWSETAIEGLMELTLGPDENGVTFDVVPLQTRNHKSLPCRCYSGFMLLPNGEDVGEALVAKGLANYAKDDGDLNLVKKNILSSLNRVYDKHRAELGSDDDSDDLGNDQEKLDSDDNDFDIVGFDQNTVLNAFGIQLPGGLKLPSSELNETDEQQPTAQSATKTAQNGVQAGPSTSTHVDENGQEPTPVVNKSIPLSTMKHPDIYWKQTATSFILKINQVDIRDYTIDIDKKKISFRTLDPPNYGFDMECFGTIDKTPEVFLTGQYLKITLKKRTNWPWPRPTHEPGRIRWLKEDIDQIEVSDDEEDTSDHPVVALPEAVASDSESDVEDLDNLMGGEGESD